MAEGGRLPQKQGSSDVGHQTEASRDFSREKQSEEAMSAAGERNGKLRLEKGAHMEDLPGGSKDQKTGDDHRPEGNKQPQRPGKTPEGTEKGKGSRKRLGPLFNETDLGNKNNGVPQNAPMKSGNNEGRGSPSGASPPPKKV